MQEKTQNITNTFELFPLDIRHKIKKKSEVIKQKKKKIQLHFLFKTNAAISMSIFFQMCL